MGRCEYETALQEQIRLSGQPVVLIFRSEPIFTMGRKGSQDQKTAIGGVPVLEVDRGGELTYHGPGQLVIFPCFSLRDFFGNNMAVKEFTQWLAGGALRFFQDLHPERKYEVRDDNPGVYCGIEKFASIGFRITKAGTSHGLALNLAFDPNFHLINPCGLETIRPGHLWKDIDQVPWESLQGKISGYFKSFRFM